MKPELLKQFSLKYYYEEEEALKVKLNRGESKFSCLLLIIYLALVQSPLGHVTWELSKKTNNSSSNIIENKKIHNQSKSV